MSEVMSQPIEPASQKPQVERTKNREADVIDLSKASAELVTSMFLSRLYDPSNSKLVRDSLAHVIEHEMSGDKQGDPSTLQARLARLSAESAFSDEDVYDHKLVHDNVFKTLAERLQAKVRTDSRDQRKAALKLLELRAAIQDHHTEDDTLWHGVYDRLFS